MKKVGFLHKIVFAALVGCCASGVGGYFLKTDICISADQRVDAPKIEGFDFERCKEGELYCGRSEGGGRIECYEYTHKDSGAKCLFALRDCDGDFLRGNHRDVVNFDVVINASGFEIGKFDKNWLAEMIDIFCSHYRKDEKDKHGFEDFGKRLFEYFGKGCCCSYAKCFDGISFSCYDLKNGKEELKKTFDALNLIKQRLETEDGLNELNRLYKKEIYDEEKNEKGEIVRSGAYYNKLCGEGKNDADSKFSEFKFAHFIKILKQVVSEAHVMIYGAGASKQDLCDSFKWFSENCLKGRSKKEYSKKQIEGRKKFPNGSFNAADVADSYVEYNMRDYKNGNVKLAKCKYVAHCFKDCDYSSREELVVPMLESALVEGKGKQYAEKLGYEYVTFDVLRCRGSVTIIVDFYGNDGGNFEEQKLKESINNLFGMLSEEWAPKESPEDGYEGALDNLMKYKVSGKKLNDFKSKVAVDWQDAEISMAMAYSETGDPFARKYFVLNEKGEIESWNNLLKYAVKNSGKVKSDFCGSDGFAINVSKCAGKQEGAKSKQSDLVFLKFKGYEDLKKEGNNLYLLYLAEALKMGAFNLRGCGYVWNKELDGIFVSCEGGNKDAKKAEVESVISGEFKEKVKNHKFGSGQFKKLKEDFGGHIREQMENLRKVIEVDRLRLDEIKQSYNDVKNGSPDSLKYDNEIMERMKKHIDSSEKCLKRSEMELSVLEKDLEKLNGLSEEDFEQGIRNFANYDIEFVHKPADDFYWYYL